MKKVLFLSSWYPSRVHTTLGNFVSYHAKAVSKTNQVHVLYIIADDSINDYEIVSESIDGIQTTIVYFKRGFFKYLNYFIAFLKGLKSDFMTSSHSIICWRDWRLRQTATLFCW